MKANRLAFFHIAVIFAWLGSVLYPDSVQMDMLQTGLFASAMLLSGYQLGRWKRQGEKV